MKEIYLYRNMHRGRPERNSMVENRSLETKGHLDEQFRRDL
jgi:hypothetical protein